MKKSIIILEPDREIQSILEARLTAAGYEVFCPVDSYVAIEHAQNHGLDLIILNDHMPIISGVDTLTFLDEAGISTPSIVFLPKIKNANGYTRRPNCICLRKPFKIDHLLDQVSRLLSM
ncbi:MAG: response regulator [bacterium]|jgi:DNA-binding response OmpR family regulator|nr:response regulator [bacterium]